MTGANRESAEFQLDAQKEPVLLKLFAGKLIQSDEEALSFRDANFLAAFQKSGKALSNLLVIYL